MQNTTYSHTEVQMIQYGSEITYIFLFQIQEVINGFINHFWTASYSNQIGICSSTLRKPKINLGKNNSC